MSGSFTSREGKRRTGARSGVHLLSGIYLEQLNWKEAESILTEKSVIVLPLGAGLKEHGLHLQLNNDRLIADYLVEKVMERVDIIAVPTITYSYYPAFVEYPGSVTLSAETASALIVEIVESLARFGPRSFYAVNTGVSTETPLLKAKEALAGQMIDFRFTDFKLALKEACAGFEEQEGGGHADEIETSLMLAIAPHTVANVPAPADFHGTGPGPLTRHLETARAGKGIYSPTGAWGDPSLATVQKGERIAARLIEYLVSDIVSIGGSDGATAR